MGHRVFELRPGHVDAVGDRLGGPLTCGGGSDVGRLGPVPRHQRLGQSGARSGGRPRVRRCADQRQVASAALRGSQVSQRDGAIQHILCHVAVFRQLAADHTDHARRRFKNSVVTRNVGGTALDTSTAGVD